MCIRVWKRACNYPKSQRAALSAYASAQDGFPLPFALFCCLLQTSPASFSLHCTLENQAPFIPASPTFSFCLFDTPPQTPQISPHGLTTCVQPLQFNWLHKTYHWSKELKKRVRFHAKDGRHVLAYEKPASLLSSLLPNKMFSFTFPLPVLLLSNLAYNTATASYRTLVAGKTLFPLGIRQWRERQLSLIGCKGHLNSVSAIPAHASHPNTTKFAYLEGFG